MHLPAPLFRGRLLRRYKRFLADIALDDGREVTAHCPNPGAMLGLREAGLEVWVSAAKNPKAKLRWRWELARRADGVLAGIDTNAPNRLVAEALAAGAIPELAGYAATRAEVKYRERSRIDFLLEDPARPPCYVEVKNVHLMRQRGLVEFPDCVTARGARHMDDLAAMKAAGARAVVLFVVQMMDAERFAVARDIDPAYARAFDAARRAGVEVLTHACSFGDPEDGAMTVTLAGRLAM